MPQVKRFKTKSADGAFGRGGPCGSLSLSLCLALAVLCFSSLGCRPNDYFLIHPLSPQPGMIRESLIFDRGQLRVHWVAYSPLQQEPLPAVLVHPDAGGLAGDTEGICLDLARHGYFAAAVHYQWKIGREANEIQGLVTDHSS